MRTLVVTFVLGLSVSIAAEQPSASDSKSATFRTIVVSGRVRHLGTTRLFALDHPLGARSSRFVLLPPTSAMPGEGTTVVVRGILQPFDSTDVGPDDRARGDLAGEMILVARSVSIERGPNPLRGAPGVPRAARRFSQSESAPATTGALSATALRPTAVASLTDELAGQNITVQSARVVGVLNPRVFLIEPATSFLMMLETRDRVAVLLAGTATLQVDREDLVGSTVNLAGVVRTPLGLRVSREVPWPTELTREYMRRLEIRAVLLATSVQSPEGVELTSGSPATTTPR